MGVRDDGRRSNRTSRLTIRFTSGEIAAVRRGAADVGVQPTTLCRAVIVDHFAGEPAIPASLAAAIGVSGDGITSDPELRHLRAEVNRIGVNFNQLMRKVNAGDVVSTEELTATLQAIELQLYRVEDALGGLRRPAGQGRP